MDGYQVQSGVMSLGSYQELRAISAAIKARWSQLSQAASFKFTVGQRVSFMTKSGVFQAAKVTKINSVTVSVRTDSGANWKVSASMLKPLGLKEDASKVAPAPVQNFSRTAGQKAAATRKANLAAMYKVAA